VSTLEPDSRVVIVGASLAGLRAAEELQLRGFAGRLTLIGDEPVEPYDRPPLSKQVAMGKVPAEHTGLPRLERLDGAEWMLGVAATGLDRDRHVVQLADGREVGYDRLLIATGVRNRPWPSESEASLDGVVSVRTSQDAATLAKLLADAPKRVLVIGGGFTGSEIASVCRHRDLEVTLAERGPAPLVGALGGVIGAIAADIQRDHGVDRRCGITVAGLEGDSSGRVRGAAFSDGTRVDAEVAVVALGAVRNTEWLRDSGLAAGPLGVSTDAGCRAFDLNGVVVDDVFAAGDVARFPHPLYEYQFLALEHWENAVTQARIAAHNMMSPSIDRLPHISVPAFWSIQFGLNIKSVGVPSFGEQIQLTQGSVKDRSFVGAYGHEGRTVGAVTVDSAKWIDFYRQQIESAAPFPPDLHADDGPASTAPMPADFPHPSVPYHTPPVMVTGHAPDEKRVTLVGSDGGAS
jgi:NADPH-dependent 2,4-dienoyl-CoA reductase/sulfur reductase-like enzyme